MSTGTAFKTYFSRFRPVLLPRMQGSCRLSRVGREGSGGHSRGGPCDAHVDGKVNRQSGDSSPGPGGAS